MSSLDSHSQHLERLLRDAQSLLQDRGIKDAHPALSVYAARLADALNALGDADVFVKNGRRAR